MNWGIQHNTEDLIPTQEIPIPNGVEFSDALSLTSSWSLAWVFFGVLIGLGCFVFFWILKNFITLRVRARLRKRKLGKLVFLLEILVYTNLVLFLVFVFLNINFIVFGAILGLVLFFSHSLILNLFYGIVFKIKNTFNIGDQIAINEISGEITELRSFALVLKNHEDDVVYIPYSKLKDEILVKQHSQGKIQSMTITMEMEAEEIKILLANGKKWLSTCPWVIGREGINVKKNSEKSISFSFQTVNIEFKSRIEAFLQNKLEK